MSILFANEVEHLKDMILRLAADVEEHLALALRAVAERDEAAARRVVEQDSEIDAREVRIEEECLKVLALHQPVASDLRFVVFVLKIDNDLERIGDLSVNIARRVRLLVGEPASDLEPRIEKTAALAKQMLRDVLDAVVHLDTGKATAVCLRDKEVDALHRETSQIVFDAISGGTGEGSPQALMTLLGVSKEIERVADHATNIAEDLLYLAKGAVVRHRGIPAAEG